MTGLKLGILFCGDSLSLSSLIKGVRAVYYIIYIMGSFLILLEFIYLLVAVRQQVKNGKEAREETSGKFSIKNYGSEKCRRGKSYQS